MNNTGRYVVVIGVDSDDIQISAFTVNSQADGSDPIDGISTSTSRKFAGAPTPTQVAFETTVQQGFSDILFSHLDLGRRKLVPNGYFIVNSNGNAYTISILLCATLEDAAMIL